MPAIPGSTARSAWRAPRRTTGRRAPPARSRTLPTRLHEIGAALGYEIAPGIRAGARYLYEWYKLEDFAWDLDPYMAGRTVENSTRFLFADATYGGYRAHLGRVYIAGRV